MCIKEIDKAGEAGLVNVCVRRVAGPGSALVDWCARRLDWPCCHGWIGARGGLGGDW